MTAAARWRELLRSGRRPDVRVRLLGSFTMDAVLPHLGTALADLGVVAEITAGPFNQIVQECVDPRSETAALEPDVLVVWPRLEEFWGEGGLDEVASAATMAAGRLCARLVLVLPATPVDRPLGAGDASNPTGVAASAASARERVRAAVCDAPGAVLCDAEETVRAVGEQSAYDHRLGVLFGIPYTELFLAAMGQSLGRSVALALRPARKVVVVDADNTLWGGAVGEIGADGVDLGPGPGEAYLAFQDHLLGLRANGVLLALCSKNLEEDVWAAFSRREMRLRRDHLSAWRVGWRAKHEAITEIAAELGVGVDAVVFVDDSPAELAEATAALPGLATVAMPADPVWWRAAVDTAALDRLPPTADDMARPERLRQDRDRDQLRQTVAPEIYLKDLEIWVEARDPEPADHRRLAQLVLKTNQLNLNGDRLSGQRLAELCASPDHAVRLVTVGDRFGDYGQVGAYVLELGDRTTARLGLFLLSCRALGRGVERAMVADAFAVADRHGIGTILATVEERQRNEPARRFFTSLGCRVGVESTVDAVDAPSYVSVRESGVGRG
ncbi:hypothetical protein BLA60_04730 [Actinophytocola xinjiangensis]|uniref:HAD superfamily phosphatase (TIGR01681 family)/FkbH-like protein n=1 Tax=Actinophytocola xinjiangensis TaxID=485602 RepID=A0A7Z0WT05_9PSEU|nr:HAD-IIIC family phosphatase [Actinophytocola xinjiangensis]OLF14428.1 hypothetical protein BLA60_04730 [Actinophytocola xinjiangensis]